MLVDKRHISYREVKIELLMEKVIVDKWLRNVLSLMFLINLFIGWIFLGVDVWIVIQVVLFSWIISAPIVEMQDKYKLLRVLERKDGRAC